MKRSFSKHQLHVRERPCGNNISALHSVYVCAHARDVHLKEVELMIKHEDFDGFLVRAHAVLDTGLMQRRPPPDGYHGDSVKGKSNNFNSCFG